MVQFSRFFLVHCMKTFHGPRFFTYACQRYARVLLSLPEKILSHLQGDLGAFLLWAHETSTRWDLLSHPLLSPPQRHLFLQEFTTKHSITTPETLSFIKSLFFHKKLALLPDIMALVSLLQEEENYTIVYVSSALSLSEKEMDVFRQHLSSHIAGPIHFKTSVAPSLLLGQIFLWKDYRIDASLSGMLQRLAKDLHYE